MSQALTLARPYARAAYAIARDAGATPTWSDALAFAARVSADPRAQSLPFPDDLMGQLVEYVVAHEVGHTLGFQHNMKASSTYPVEKLRDPEWLK